MNWRRGMLRLWIVVSLVWAAGILVWILPNPPRSPAEGGGHAFQAGDLAFVIIMMALPPIAVLIGSVLATGVVRYVVKGFRSP
jgi:hypothetical protein